MKKQQWKRNLKTLTTLTNFGTNTKPFRDSQIFQIFRATNIKHLETQQFILQAQNMKDKASHEFAF